MCGEAKINIMNTMLLSSIINAQRSLNLEKKIYSKVT